MFMSLLWIKQLTLKKDFNLEVFKKRVKTTAKHVNTRPIVCTNNIAVLRVSILLIL